MQQPQEEARTAMAQTGMASSRRVMVDLFISRWIYLKRELIATDQKKTPPASVRREGLESVLLRRCLVGRRWRRSAWAAGSGEECCNGGNEGKFDHVHSVRL